MAIKNRQELKSFFETNKRPKEVEFSDLIDSYVHKTEDDFVDTNQLNSAIASQAPGLAPVQSVNGFQGNVVIPPAPVTSVNGFQGIVNLNIPVLEDSGWQNITSFSNSTSNYTTSTSMRCRKKNGVVYLDGCLKGGSDQTNGISYILFSLPSGFWPSRRTSFAVVRANTAATFILGRIDIDIDGKVYGVNYSKIWTNFSDISFVI